jgi:hypothetical protein
MHLDSFVRVAGETSVGSGNSGRWIPEILAPSPETLAV